MGSFVKALGTLGNVAAARLAAPAAADTSRGILKYSAANKTGLSLLLDGTLKQGHDMKTFGLGTAASLANISRYARFTAAMRHVYGAMEETLDASTSPAIVPLWRAHGDALRRAPALTLDLADVALPLEDQKLDDLYPPTAATRRYVDAIATAGAKDNADGGGRLIGHLYCRYVYLTSYILHLTAHRPLVLPVRVSIHRLRQADHQPWAPLTSPRVGSSHQPWAPCR